MSVNVFAIISPKPEFFDDVFESLIKLVASTRSEIGNTQYDFFKGLGDDDNFYLIESYLDINAFEEHQKTKHYLDYRDKAKDWLKEPTVVKVFEPVDL